MHQFSHILITRFNVKMEHWPSKIQLSESEKIQWTENRWQLFEYYCLRSILQQSVTNFKWLIYFDIKTTDKIKKKIHQLQKEQEFIVPLYVLNHKTFKQNLEKDILAQCRPDDTHVITTRIDNDDCFHRNAIARIQHCFQDQDYAIFNFMKGHFLQVSPVHLLSDDEYPSGPFLSMIEKLNTNSLNQFVFSKDHYDFIEDGNLIQIKDAQYWVQIIHDNNVYNRFRGIPTRRINTLSQFGIDPTTIDIDLPTHFQKKMKYLFIIFPFRQAKRAFKLIVGRKTYSWLLRTSIGNLLRKINN
jgi:hypothetical protein